MSPHVLPVQFFAVSYYINLVKTCTYSIIVNGCKPPERINSAFMDSPALYVQEVLAHLYNKLRV